MKHCAKEWLMGRSIDMTDLAKVTYALKGLSTYDLDATQSVLEEIIEIPSIKDFILLGITLDVYAENRLLPEPLLARVLENRNTLNHALSISILSAFDQKVSDYYYKLLSSQSSPMDQFMDGHTCDCFLKSILAVILSIAVEAY